MPKSIQLVKKSTVEVPDLSSYKLIVEAINPQNMTSKIFINQRIRNYAADRFDDVFVGICTPVQLEDFPEDAPNENSSYYRTAKVELVGRTTEMIQTVFDSMLYEVKKLVVDLDDMDSLQREEIYTISASGPVTVN